MKTIQLLVGIIFLLTAQTLNAQHELTVYGGGGVSSLQYKSQGNHNLWNIAPQAGVGYSYNFSPVWSIGTGVEFTMYKGETTIENIQASTPIATPAGFPKWSNFFVQYAYKNYTETQEARYINIPLMLQCTVGKFYIAGAVKFGFPLSAHYTVSAHSLSVTGYSDYTAQMYEDMPAHGFTTYSNFSSSESLHFNIAYIGALEAGMKWNLTDKLRLYTGAYFDYGFNNILEKGDYTVPTLYEYNESNPTDVTVHSILQSQNENADMVNKIRMLSFGLKLKLGFGRK